MTLPNSSSINSYGSGVLVDAVPLVDPTSELGAAALNPLRNDVSAMTAVVPRCMFQFQAVSSGNPSIFSSPTWTAGVDSVWGNSFAVQPTIVRNSEGFMTVTMPATVSDQIGNNNLVNVRWAECKVISGTTTVATICVVTSASTFTIQLGTLGANDFAGTIFSVVVY